MLEALFGNESIERVFFYLLKNKTCYALQLKKQFQSTLSPMQQALLRLERGGILVSTLVGKTRIFQFNPRYRSITYGQIFHSLLLVSTKHN
jgi:predicted transcriptional regulator